MNEKKNYEIEKLNKKITYPINSMRLKKKFSFWLLSKIARILKNFLITTFTVVATRGLPQYKK